MHPNPTFRDTDEAQARTFAKTRGFGVFAVNGDDAPMTAHIPFHFANENLLHAHLVVSNPIWRMLSDGPLQALVTVSGPDSYISPDWYEIEDQVPTWNYVAVNLRGTLRALEQQALRGIIDALSESFEARLAPKPLWHSDKMNDDVMARMMRQIRPIALDIKAVESTYKLGQNKTDEVRIKAAKKVAIDGIGSDVTALAALMDDA